MSLPDYIFEHTCRSGEGIDVYFFNVGIVDEPDADILRELVNMFEGEYEDINLFDKKEHSYIEIGAWIGSQELALLLMGLGEHLGLWTVLSPNNVLSFLTDNIDELCEDNKKLVLEKAKKIKDNAAGLGLITIIAK